MEKWADRIFKGAMIAAIAVVGISGYVNADLAIMLAAIAFAAVVAGLWE